VLALALVRMAEGAAQEPILAVLTAARIDGTGALLPIHHGLEQVQFVMKEGRVYRERQ
jgi:hypothetical protein